jgi:hypothetical protein
VRGDGAINEGQEFRVSPLLRQVPVGEQAMEIGVKGDGLGKGYARPCAEHVGKVQLHSEQAPRDFRGGFSLCFALWCHLISTDR